MDASPHMVPRMSRRGRRPEPQTGGEREEELFALADRIADEEDVPIEFAYKLAMQRLEQAGEA